MRGEHVAANPPPLVSPVPSLQVRAVLDQDALLTAGLTHAPGGQRVVLLVSAGATRPGEREEFTQWCRALTDVCAVARTSAVADFGHTEDGRPFLATYVHRSLADQLRLVGPPEPRLIRHMGATVADALAASHSYGLVHAAVSPATVMMVDDGVRLGGFGATAPGLTGPLGVWAFTAPEHRAAAAAGESTGSPAGDVFALAATVCVALAGVLPWSDPVSWADAAGLDGGPDAPRWVTAIRAALNADPDKRPSAEEMAEALRSPAAPLPDRPPGAKVDLRGLIPRKVRRLAAYSIDAMADGPTPVVGRAKPGSKGGDAAPEDAVRKSRGARLAALIRSHRAVAAVVGMVAALLVGVGAYAWAVSGGSSGPDRPAATRPGDDAVLAALLTGAREAGEDFLHNVGNASSDTCATVHGDAVVTVPHSTAPVTCEYLVAHAARLLSSHAVVKMRTARVTQAVGYNNGGIPDPDPHAVITLVMVPDLQGVLSQFEMVLTYRDGQWWVVRVTFA
jgi:hypothetical protein